MEKIVLKETNRIREYYANKKNQEENYNFFDHIKPKTEGDFAFINEKTKKIKKLEKELSEEVDALNGKWIELYNTEIDLFNYDVIIEYSPSRRNASGQTFSFDTGMPLKVEPKNPYYISIGTKCDHIIVPIGYIYKFGAILFRIYNVAVNATLSKIKIDLAYDYLLNIIEGTTQQKYYKSITNPEYYDIFREVLLNIESTKFVEEMFGRTDVKIDLYTLKEGFKNNKNTETILKCAPLNSISKLLSYKCDKPCAIYQMLGVEKNDYELAVENDLLIELIKYLDYIKSTSNFNLTVHEWLDLIKESQGWAADLNYYGISYNNWRTERDSLPLTILAQGYLSRPNLRENYTFRKFCNYVVNATIDQGFNGVDDFICSLDDYIKMCLNNGGAPIWETNYLKLSHDISARNYKVKVSEEEEKIFAERYKDWKNYKGSVYSLIAPTKTSDVKAEGCKMNHCVASYIHRIVKGECLIVFMRKTDNLEEPLVTVEIRNNAIVQYKGKHNRNLTETEKNFLKSYANKKNMAFK